MNNYDKEMSKAVFKQLVNRAHANSKDKGFWASPDGLDQEDIILAPGDEAEKEMQTYLMLAKLMLIGTEVSEAAECVRKGEYLATVGAKTGKPVGLMTELADVVIRVFDLAAVVEEMTGETLGGAVLYKMEYNESRPKLHGKRA
jgi:NTP pyrophosphatase (non-canonical NTP hydrolase)